MKKIIVIMILTLLLIFNVGCTKSVDYKNNIENIDNTMFYVKTKFDGGMIIVDKETGVNYIYLKVGVGYNSILGLTERYDSNGNLIIDPVE